MLGPRNTSPPRRSRYPAEALGTRSGAFRVSRRWLAAASSGQGGGGLDIDHFQVLPIQLGSNDMGLAFQQCCGCAMQRRRVTIRGNS